MKYIRTLGFFLDTSPTGAGKTFNVMAVAQILGFYLLIINPKSASMVWKKWTKLYGIESECMSYEKLSGRKESPPTHGLLELRDGKYYATQKLHELAAKGVFVVIDEAHNIKNQCGKSEAVIALLKAVHGTRSRFALLSATMVDKMDHYIQFYKALGLYTDRPALTENLQGTHKGYDEVLEKVSNLGVAITGKQIIEIPRDFRFVYGYPASYLNELFQKHILPACSSAMSVPELPMRAENLHAEVVNKEMDELLHTSREALYAAVSYRGENSNVKITSDSYGAINKACMDHEWGLSELAVRECLAWTNQNPGGKVLVFASYTRTIEFLRDQLNPMGIKTAIFNGSLSDKKREAVVNDFQDGDTTVFASNIIAGGVAISLHDLVGEQPRLILIFPTYRVIDTIQAIGRGVRRGMKTEAVVRILYSERYPLLSVFNVINRKSGVIRANNAAGALPGSKARVYPDSFPKTHQNLEDAITLGGELSVHWHAERLKKNPAPVLVID